MSLFKKFQDLLPAFFIAFGLNLLINQIVKGASLTVPDISYYQGMVQDPGQVNDIESGVATLIVNVVLNIRYVITAATIAIWSYSGYLMIIKRGDPKQWEETKTTLIWGILGLALIGFSGDLARIFAGGRCQELTMLPGSNTIDCIEGGFMKDPNTLIQRAGLFNNWVQSIVIFVKYFIGAVAVEEIVRSALKMATNTGSEEIAKDKLNIVLAIVGLIVIVLADPLINKVFFVIDKSHYPTVNGTTVAVDYVQGISEVVGFTNLLVSIIAPIMILVIVIAGVMYVAAGGNTDTQKKATNMITYAVIGLVIVYGAFALVSSFISGRFDASVKTGLENQSNTQVVPNQT